MFLKLQRATLVVLFNGGIRVLLLICFFCFLTLLTQQHLLQTQNSDFLETQGRNEDSSFEQSASPLDEAQFQNRPRHFCRCGSESAYATTQRTGSQSTCSDEATDAGPGQKVISYSLFLKSGPPSEQRYSTSALLEGVKLNLEGMRSHYPPDWKMRLYSNLQPLHNNLTCALICNYSDLYWCDVAQIPELGDMTGMVDRTWRFLPLGDPLVEAFVSRDLDSDISGREWAVVAEWLALKYPFHIMRDNQHHADYPVLAGMWGLRQSLLPAQQLKTLQSNIIEESKLLGPRAGKNADQDILAKFIAPLRNLTLAHDSFFCRRASLSVGLTIPFNTKLDIPCQYVGGIRYDRCARDHCPEECRPSYGKDWVHC